MLKHFYLCCAEERVDFMPCSFWQFLILQLNRFSFPLFVQTKAAVFLFIPVSKLRHKVLCTYFVWGLCLEPLTVTLGHGILRSDRQHHCDGTLHGGLPLI